MGMQTIESDFEYQADIIFQDMANDYKEEQKSRVEGEDEVQTFAEWLWSNRDDLGERFYTRFDEYSGMEESTYKFNIE